MEEDNSFWTSVIVSKKSFFETSKLEEEMSNSIKDGTLSKNLEDIDEISMDLLEVNKNEYQKNLSESKYAFTSFYFKS